MIYIKSVKYGDIYVTKEDERAKTTKQPDRENVIDAIKEDIARIRDEMIKQNRDNLDALYNIDTENLSSNLKQMFATWTDGINVALAGVKVSADEYQSLYESFTSFKTETSTSLTSIKQTSTANEAKISSLASWKNEAINSMASIEQTANSAYSKATTAVNYATDASNSVATIEAKADKNSARISLLVNAEGDELSSSAAGIIANAVAGEESLLQLIADHVTISAENIDLSGYVTISSLEDPDSGVEIDGDLIRLIMDGSVDTGSNRMYGSEINYEYKYSASNKSNIVYASLWTTCENNDTDIGSRYAVNIDTYTFENDLGDTFHPAVKVTAAGRISLESGSRYCDGAIYMSSNYGYIKMDSMYGTRITAENSFNDVLNAAVGDNEYVFCKDGIYYGDTCILSI